MNFFVLFMMVGVSVADFGDYADHSFSCPAKTTCPQVCVDVAEDCPTSMKCPEFESLCADGSCATFCDPDLTSPCTSSCASVACPKIVTFHDVCQRNFSLYYDYANSCDIMFENVVNDSASLSWTHPACVVVYVWILGVTFGIVAWCWYK